MEGVNMTLIPALILMPLLSAILILICKKEKIRSLIIYVSVFLILLVFFHPVLDPDEQIVIRAFDVDQKAEHVVNLPDRGRRRTDEKASLRKIARQQGKPLRQRRSCRFLRRADLDGQNVSGGGIGQQPAVHDLFLIKALVILGRRMDDAVMLRLVGLNHHLAGPAAPARPARRLGQELVGSL